MDRSPNRDPFDARARFRVGDRELTIHRLDRLTLAHGDRAPVTVRILLEDVLRHAGGGMVTDQDVDALAAWRPGAAAEVEVPFLPARVILQDFTGVPAVVDLAA